MNILKLNNKMESGIFSKCGTDFLKQELQMANNWLSWYRSLLGLHGSWKIRDKKEEDKVQKRANEINDELKNRNVNVIATPKDYSFLKEGCYAWVQGSVGFPVRVQIITINAQEKTALIKSNYQEGTLPFEKFYPTEKECPCR